MGNERNAGKQGDKGSAGKQATGFPRSFGANFFTPLPAKSEATKQSINQPVNQPFNNSSAIHKDTKQSIKPPPTKQPLVEFATKPSPSAPPPQLPLPPSSAPAGVAPMPSTTPSALASVAPFPSTFSPSPLLAKLASLPQADRRLLFPDIPNPDMGQWADDCAAYAFERVCGYAAAACFLGKVAGVVGTDEEIEQARAIIKSAFAEIGNILYGGSDDIRALRAEQHQLDEQIYHHSHARSMLGPTMMEQTPEAMEVFHHAYKAAMETGDLSSIDELRQITRETLFGGGAQVFRDGYIDNLKQEIVARRRLNEVQHKRRLLGDRDVSDVVVDYFKGVWDSIKKIYNELVENIESGRWKYGLCKASIDGGLLIFEEGVGLAATAAFAAVGLAGLGVIMRIATIVVADGVKVARRLSEVRHIHVNLTFTRQPVKGQLFDGQGEQMISRDTKVKPHELNDTHKKFFDEDYQGNFTGNPPPAKPKEPKPAAPTALTPAALRQKLGLKNITDKEIILAGKAGVSEAQTKARRKLVESFAEATGSQKQLKDMIDPKTGGMNLEKFPVRIVEIPKGSKVSQWVNEHGVPGNWFDPSGTAHPSALGISPTGRTLNNFTMKQDGFVIESVAKPVKVTWGVDKGYPAVGGAKQWFMPEKYKPGKDDTLGPARATWRDLERAGLHNVKPDSKEKLDIFKHNDIKINND